MFPSLSALDSRSLCVSGALSEDARREAENDEISKRECPRGLYCEDPIQAEMMSEYIRTYLTVNGKHTVVDTLNSGASGKYSKIYVVMPAVLKLRDSRKGLREMLEPLIESLLENYGKPDARVGVIWLYEIQDPNMPGKSRSFKPSQTVTFPHVSPFRDHSNLFGRIDKFSPSLSSYCLLYTSPSPRDRTRSRMPSSA